MRDAVPDPADVPSDADSDSDSDSDSDDARVRTTASTTRRSRRARRFRGHPPWASPAACSAAASPNPAPRPSARLRARLPTRSPSRPGRPRTRRGRRPRPRAHWRRERRRAPRHSALPRPPDPRRVDPTRGSRALGTWRVPTRAAAQPVLQIELATLPNGSGWFGGEDHAPPALCATRDRHGAALCAVGGGAGNPPREAGTRRGAGTPRSPRDEHGHPRERSCGRSRPSTRATPPRTSRSIHTACPRCWWRPRTARCVAWTPPAVLARAGRAPRGSAPATGTGTGGRGARTRRTRAWLYRRRRKRFVWLIFARGDEARGTSSRRATRRARPWRAMAGPRRPVVARRRPSGGATIARLRDTSRVATTTTTTRARTTSARARPSTRSRWRATRRSNSAIFDDPRRRRRRWRLRLRRRARVVARGPDGGVAGNAPPRDRDGGRRG